MNDISITFVANFMNHHQLPFSKELVRLTNGHFTFIAYTPLPEESKLLGYTEMNSLPFVLKAYESADNSRLAKIAVENSDMVIFGSCPNYLLEIRKKVDKPYIIYSERFFKKGTYRRFIPITYWKIYKRMLQHQGSKCSIIASSAYLPYDLSLLHAKFKIYKWGYFTKASDSSYDELLEKKSQNIVPKLLWVARFIPLKHPEQVVQLAMKLKQAGIGFQLDMIGDGPMKKKIQAMINDLHLVDCVRLLGSMPADDVRLNMERSDIFVFTSDQNEGWGAVVNEAMASGCAIVASHEVGSVPYLVRHGHNGYIYKSGDTNDLYVKTSTLIRSKDVYVTFGQNAILTINQLWNPKTAASRLFEIIEAQVNSMPEPSFEDGPCSIAKVIKPRDILSND